MSTMEFILITVGDIMMHMGDIMSTLGVFITLVKNLLLFGYSHGTDHPLRYSYYSPHAS